MLEQTLGALRRAGTLTAIGAASRRVSKAEDEAARAAATRRLAELLADARGVPMKVGQLFATGHAGDAFAPLVNGIPCMPSDVVNAAIARGLGRTPAQLFRQLEEHGHAASLGEVHRAVDHAGEVLAVKVQYPDIRQHVDAELRLLGLMPGLGPVKKWGFDLRGYQSALKQDLDEELDYASEAQRQAAFANAVHVDGLVVPRPHLELCSSTVLVQQWCDGEDIVAAEAYPVRDRVALARILLETLFTSLFGAGCVHADPNPGNYRFQRTEAGPRVVLFDFGSVVQVPADTRLALLKLILALREGTPISTHAAWAACGFDSKKLGYIAPSLPELSRVLLAPFLTDRAFDPHDWHIGEQLTRLLGELRWWFRAAGPPRLFLLMRAFQGITQQLTRLGVNLPWFAILRRSAEPLFAAARDFQLPGLDSDAGAVTEGGARLLRVQVLEADVEKIALSFPARAALTLQELVPAEVRSTIEGRGVDLQDIEGRLQKQGLARQVLFCESVEEKLYKVWLE